MVTIDEAIVSGALLVPHHLKIDVDVFEHKVLTGASDLLGNSTLRSILVEINPSLSEHHEIIFGLTSLGFEYDENQVNRTIRKEGPFQGVGEWIFRCKPIYACLTNFKCASYFGSAGNTNLNILDHVLNRIRSTEIKECPFPISIVDNVFPAEYYSRILKNFPSDEQLVSLCSTGRASGGPNEKRRVALLSHEHLSRLSSHQLAFWTHLRDWILSSEFASAMLHHFTKYFGPRLHMLSIYDDPAESIHGDALLVSDRSGYGIGPRTDAPHRLISFLFYCSVDDKSKHLGTSLYSPRKAGMICSGMLHHPRDESIREELIESVPICLLYFLKLIDLFTELSKIQTRIPTGILLFTISDYQKQSNESWRASFAAIVSLIILDLMLLVQSCQVYS
ncbi:hypothetical protein [Synechococcus sp. CBW1107]|uniref:hypothetical protein n=1 Tax=Synechococcus sp. CBW1107 TaxID=2789857 RepID=UPI002AD23194|nr:hypothetical protein [Synechococcus sp. CBW1107]CAK6697952.1 hypothetical protein IFHNHDMJ_02333 [Synechococcus sp. CBW1107]